MTNKNGMIDSIRTHEGMFLSETGFPHSCCLYTGSGGEAQADPLLARVHPTRAAHPTFCWTHTDPATGGAPGVAGASFGSMTGGVEGLAFASFGSMTCGVSGSLAGVPWKKLPL